jgi:hypothetical protein
MLTGARRVSFTLAVLLSNLAGRRQVNSEAFYKGYNQQFVALCFYLRAQGWILFRIHATASLRVVGILDFNHFSA